MSLVGVASQTAFVIFALLLATGSNDSVAAQNTCGGNCPSGSCPGNHCPCGVEPMQLSTAQVASFCAQHTGAGGWSQSCCECIIQRESIGNAHAVDYEQDYQNFKVGLLQIPDMFWGKCNNGWPPCSTEATLTCAIENWKLGNGTWALWDYTCPNCGSCCSSP